MVDGIRKPSRNPRSRKSAAGKLERRDAKTGMLMGVGSRKAVLLGVRSFLRGALSLGMTFFAAGGAGVVEDAFGVEAAFLRVESVADPALSGATAIGKGLTRSG